MERGRLMQSNWTRKKCVCLQVTSSSQRLGRRRLQPKFRTHTQCAECRLSSPRGHSVCVVARAVINQVKVIFPGWKRNQGKRKNGSDGFFAGFFRLHIGAKVTVWLPGWTLLWFETENKTKTRSEMVTVTMTWWESFRGFWLLVGGCESGPVGGWVCTKWHESRARAFLLSN